MVCAGYCLAWADSGHMEKAKMNSWGFSSAQQDSAGHEAGEVQANEWIIEAQRSRGRGEWEQAQQLLGQAYEIVQESDDWTINYRYYVENGQLNRILGNYDEAASSFKALFELFGDDEEYVRYKAVNYTNLGVVYTAAGKYRQAMETMEKSLEYRYKTPSDSIGLSVSYKSIGEIHRAVRQYEEAYEAYSTALEYLADLDYPLQEADLLYGMGSIQTVLGLSGSAKLYFDRTLAIGQELGSPGLLVRGYSGLGEYYSAASMPEESRENWIKAIDVMGNARHPMLIGIYINALRESIALHQEDAAGGWLDPAEEWLANLEELIEEYGSDANRGSFHLVRGGYKNAIGNYEGAETDFTAALDLLEQILRFRIHPFLYWSRAFNMMELEYDRGMELAEQAVLLTDTYRQQVTFSGDIRAGYFKSLSPYYAKLARKYIEQDENAAYDAFRVMELNKSRAFAEDLNLRADFVKSYMEAHQWERYQDLRRQIVDAEIASMNIAEPQEQVEALWELENLTREAESIYSATLNGNPELKQFLAPPALSLIEAQGQLAPEEAGLQLGVQGRYITAVLFTESEAESWLIEVPGNEADAFVNQLRESITTQASLDELMPELAAAGERFFPEPVRNLLERSRYLTISTDGTLAYLPFDALRLDGRYLTEMVSVRYTPSFSVQQILAERRLARSQSGAAPRALALAAPDFRAPESLPASLRENQAVLRPLPYAQLEGRWLEASFSGETTLVTGPEATMERLLEELTKDYSLLHFATHGILNEYTPQLSGIVLAEPNVPETGQHPGLVAEGTRGSATNTQTDSFLPMSRIYELSLDSDLVVLSACNTGIGEVIDGEGVLGFKRAFMFAGAHAVAVSMWSVQDRSTALLMRSFYERLQETEKPINQLNSLAYAEALQKARLQLIRQRSYQHPAYWAAFTISGG